jgi:hypothetical protein|tara:strand:+ start:12950 stop:13162 length:213 start_codon:yes stop_codon:yes gene_type:complete
VVASIAAVERTVRAKRRRRRLDGSPKVTAALGSRHPWEERFDLGPLRVGQMDAASGYDYYLRPGEYQIRD